MTTKEILDFIRSKADRPMKIKEMANILGIPDVKYPSFRNTIKKLVESGELVKLKRNRIGVSDKLNIAVGNISISRNGTGFLEREGEDIDVMIFHKDLHTSLDGDKVMVRLTGSSQGRPTGVVVKVVERTHRKIVGIFRTGGAFSFVVPDNPKIHRDIYIHPDFTENAKDGEKVVAELTSWEHPHLNPEGRVTEVLGYPFEPGVDMLSVIKSFGLPEEFPVEVIDEAEEAAGRSIDKEIDKRLDLTGEIIYTIDPEDAKDHDDAISVEATDFGYRLGVHIADVSFFVENGSAMDKEAFERGNSVYLPGMVIPMLPEVLSNDVCSLRPDRWRLAHSAFMDIDNKGQILKWKIADTVIESKAKLSYEEVQRFFDTGTIRSKVKKVAESLLLARKLAHLLNKARFAEGSLDFDLPEAKVILNEKGEVLELGSRVRLESHRLIEEFMLAANKVVALEVFRKGQPFLYRVHARPDMEKINAFAHLVESLGYPFPVARELKPKIFARFLEKIKDAPEADFINELMLRSMQKAVYQRENIGHFGLAFSHYTHFTSPIRRYPDLMVHRLLRKLSRRKTYPTAFAKKIPGVIDHVGRHCSETERTAETAERQAIKVKQVAYMAERLGQEYHGIISGVVPYGFFVRIDNMGVEGLVRLSSIDDDYYQHDESHYLLVGRRKKRTFRLGDKIDVGVLKVDREHHEIDFYLAENNQNQQKQPNKKKSKGRRQKKRKNRVH